MQIILKPFNPFSGWLHSLTFGLLSVLLRALAIGLLAAIAAAIYFFVSAFAPMLLFILAAILVLSAIFFLARLAWAVFTFLLNLFLLIVGGAVLLIFGLGLVTLANLLSRF